MSKHEESFQIPLVPDQAKALCGQAIASLNLPVNDLGYGFSTAETFQFGFTWPVTINLIIHPGPESASLITIAGSNFGFGPIQSNHVRNKVQALRQRIEQMLASGPKQ